MNRKIGMISAVINIAAVFAFAISMLLGNGLGSYFSSMLIAFSFVPMICAYAYFSKDEKKLAGMTAAGFAVIYATLISLVYFTQVTTVQAGSLSESAASLLDFRQFGLFFNYDMLGYAFMSLAALFAGLTLDGTSIACKWLKGLLIAHGIFFVSCFILPMLGLFTADLAGADRIGVAVLEFWCAYFIPVGILSFLHFSKLKS